MIIGTAGHIDHGKTALVRALTGVETDRLPEEQARGITLELGYAYQPDAAGGVLGFVDVPGHERLVHTMVAGATGIDFVLLVVAADDGPMPQTREHLQVLHLLGLAQGAVVLTKIDRVSAERQAIAAAEVRALLTGTALAGAPLFPVSALTGDGVPALWEHLRAAAARRGDRPDDDRGFRLAIDRSFSLTGAGTVVTGTVHSGTVRQGDLLRLTPSGREARVRGLHAQGRPASLGRTGERCALNLAGAGLHPTSIPRGEWVVAPPLHLPTRRFDGWLQVLADAPRPLAHWTPVHCHLGTSDLTGRVAVLEGEAIPPGAAGLVQLELEQPLGTLRGDRFILRDQSARLTWGGGRVLDPAAPVRGRRRPARLGLLRALRDPDPSAAVAAALPVAEAGLALERLAQDWNLSAAARAALGHLPDTVLAGAGADAVLFAAPVWADWQQRVLAALAAEHQRAPERLGPDRERLRRMAAPRLARPAFAALLAALEQVGQVHRAGPCIHLPSHSVRLAPAAAALWQRVHPLLAAQPYNPPRVRDLARDLGEDEQAVRQVLRQAVGLGEVFLVAQDHFFTRGAVAHMAAIARELNARDGAARAAAFRDQLGIGRKVAIQILEFFDRGGYSRRVGDDHRVFQDSLFAVGEPRAPDGSPDPT